MPDRRPEQKLTCSQKLTLENAKVTVLRNRLGRTPIDKAARLYQSELSTPRQRAFSDAGRDPSPVRQNRKRDQASEL